VSLMCSTVDAGQRLEMAEISQQSINKCRKPQLSDDDKNIHEAGEMGQRAGHSPSTGQICLIFRTRSTYPYLTIQISLLS
jgi:hypothetical protein